MVSIKRTVFLPTVTVLKNTVRLIGTTEYTYGMYTYGMYTYGMYTRYLSRFFD